MSRPIRVLFIHGLESHPNGSKTRMLREQGFEVVAPDMHMGLLQWRRRNSAIRQVVRLNETLAALALTGALMRRGIQRSSRWAIVGSAALFAGWGLVRHQALFAKALGKSFDASITIVRDALKTASPDIVVGSSFGGAVAVELLLTHAWSGPTILLAPAVHRIAVRSRRGDGSDVSARFRALRGVGPVVVFHDPSDDIVPFRDSLDLTHDSDVELRSVDGGGHRLLALLERGELKRTIEDLVENPI